MRPAEQRRSLFDLALADVEAGFRLERFELYNWGTFDHAVWHLAPQGHNSLLTGDIGSGKSTIVDGLLTLLVPHNRIVYNKAAGAESRERTLYSYVRGEYKSEKDNLTGTAKAVALRDGNQYTVLLARFTNQGYKQSVTLAQVFWLKDRRRNPERFFVVATRPLSIAEDFSNFGSNILDLRKKLRQEQQLEVLTHFKEYSARFRRLFGIESEQALNLFYQTVSMKSVGNLTDFVRRHMLELPEVEERIGEIRRNFDNLNQAHQAVLHARARIEELKPLVKDWQRHRKVADRVDELEQCREGLEPWFGAHKAALLREGINQLDQEIEKRGQQIETTEEALHHLRNQESDLKTAIDESGGRRLADLAREIEQLSRERTRKSGQEQRYQQLVQGLDLAKPANEEQFLDNRRQGEQLLARSSRELEELTKRLIDAEISIRDCQAQSAQLTSEIGSLKKRQSNIPGKHIRIRREMAAVLAVAEEELPFAGELLQVDEREKEWQGAIERVCHSFGLSLLVSEALYQQVSHYVDRTRLQGRLVYFRAREEKQPVAVSDDPRELWRKLRIKTENHHYPWLEREIRRRFNLVCCDSLDEFRRLPGAVTRQGQIKSRNRRHEKDDRYPVNDRSRYVLGWSNREKIRALEQEADKLQARGAALKEQRNRLDKQRQQLDISRDCCRDLLRTEHFSEINWQPLARQIQALEDERREIEASSDLLRSLQERLKQVGGEIQLLEQRRETLRDKRSRAAQKKEDRQAALDQVRRYADFPTEQRTAGLVAMLDGFRDQVLPGKAFTLINLDSCQRRIRGHIQEQINSQRKKTVRLAESIIRRMNRFKTNWPAESKEVDAALEAGPEYRRMLQSLVREDLPRHEARFKEMLNEGTINSIALFQNQMEKERQEIRDRIDTINISLKEAQYNPGTYIELVADPTTDPEIRDFQQQVRQCLAHSLAGDELYDESRFLLVKKLIDRFNGRQGTAELDRRWTVKVTDVRNWFTFSACERWQEDGREKEYYSDSSGKSGGQKEKLAYTILASALAYQFGLEWGATRSRSFRFVVIDEAFGRGSDESTRYGLELFKRLNLQLLIVTPLQKIHIIEDYIHAVHFIHNEEGRNSMVRNLTIEEYREEKKRRSRTAVP
ncbi:MAG: ATP-dependent exonuclease SbcCD, C subunit-like protein [Desulfobacterales bacterium]|nr:ATP-dependent exonuclease SbcCD, C subunit-like protein [Desulfobacterales bacterium]